MIFSSIENNIQKTPNFYGNNQGSAQAVIFPARQSFAANPTLERTPSFDSISLTTDKKKMSKGEKVGISVAIAAVVGGAIAFAVSRGRNTKGIGNGAKKLAEKIEFVPAKTLEEAKLFSKDKLGVHIDGDISLDVINYANEGMCQLRNKSPKDFKIKWLESSPIEGGYDAEALAQSLKLKGDKDYYGINLSSDYIKHLDKTIKDFLKVEIKRGAILNNNSKLQYNKFFQNADISTEITELMNKFHKNSSTLSFKEKVRLHLGLGDIGETMDKLYIKHNGDISKIPTTIKINSNPFHPIFHEQGHFLHEMNNPKTFALLECVDALKQKNLDTSLTEEFLSKHKSIASKITEYAEESPAEFVAEVYAKSLDGVKFDKDVLNLYKKYDGPKLA